MIQGCLFDLDGVIVDTAHSHFESWQSIAHELGVKFTLEENENLKGIGRMESLDFILSLGDIQLPEKKKHDLTKLKNQRYQELIANMTQDDILKGVLGFIDQLDSRGIRMGIGSSSKNARIILEKIGLTQRFECIVDGTNISKSKPDPEVFLLGAEALGLMPGDIVVVEDSFQGIEAAISGGFCSIGIGELEVLGRADIVVKSLSDISMDQFMAIKT